MLSAKYGFLINRKVQMCIRDRRFCEKKQSRSVFVHATLHSSKPDGIAACPQFLTEKRENAKCFPEFPEKLD